MPFVTCYPCCFLENSLQEMLKLTAQRMSNHLTLANQVGHYYSRLCIEVGALTQETQLS